MRKFFSKPNLLKISLLIIFCFLVINPVKSETGGDYNDNPVIREISEEIENKKEKIDTLKYQADQYLERINEKRRMSQSLKDELEILDNQIAKIKLDIQSNQIQIDQINLEMKTLQYYIDKENEKIDRYKEHLEKYLKLIDKQDKKSYLEILILNESLSEFFTQINYVEELQSELQKSLNRIKAIKESLDVKKAEMELKKQELEELNRTLDIYKEKLEIDIKAKEFLILNTQNSELEYQKLLAAAKSEQNEIDSDIVSLQENIQAKINQLEEQKRQALRNQQTRNGKIILDWPVDPSRGITAYFHDPDYPYRYIFEHPGIDIRAYQGTELRASADGYVAIAKDAGYGYSYIVIIHDNAISTVYGHVSAIYVKQDQFVNRGELIGLSGGMPGTRGAGNLTTGPHLHYEVRLNGIPVNPLEYLD